MCCRYWYQKIHLERLNTYHSSVFWYFRKLYYLRLKNLLFLYSEKYLSRLLRFWSVLIFNISWYPSWFILTKSCCCIFSFINDFHISHLGNYKKIFYNLLLKFLKEKFRTDAKWIWIIDEKVPQSFTSNSNKFTLFWS